LHLGISKERLVFFFDKELFLDIASMVAGTSTEDNLKKLTLMAEVENDKSIILLSMKFILLFGGSLDASNMFKPALARGEIQIGATTLDEYRNT
jgi:ATP-dependent Clp protease ATP-binding subunit ClpC